MVHIHCGADRQREGAVQETGAFVGVVGFTSQPEARLGLLPVDDPHLETQPEGFETPPGLREEPEGVGVSVLVGDPDGQIQHRQGVIIDSSLAAVELSKSTTIAVLGVREPWPTLNKIAFRSCVRWKLRGAWYRMCACLLM